MTYRVLSLDGGGIRGLITVILMQRLNQEPGLENWLSSGRPDRRDLHRRPAGAGDRQGSGFAGHPRPVRKEGRRRLRRFLAG